MGERKDIRRLSADEKTKFIEALVELKKNGLYDQFVGIHQKAMAQTRPLAGEIANSAFRNGAH